MKKEELFEAMNDIDEDKIKKAGEYSVQKKNTLVKWIAPIACAAAAFLLLIFCLPLFKGRGGVSGEEPGTPGSDGGVQTGGNKTQEGSTAGSGSTDSGPADNGAKDTVRPAEASGEVTVPVAAAVYPDEVKRLMAECPEPVAEGMSAEDFLYGSDHWDWWEGYRETLDYDLNRSMGGYYQSVMEKLLVSDENTVCSPLNTYFAFSMLAEVSEGDTRQQILDMLGVADIESLRKNTSDLFLSNYVDTPVIKSLPANSIWLNGDLDYNEDTLDTLSEKYFVSSFRGKAGSEEMNEALRIWTDTNTGGLLSEYTKDMYLSEDLIMSIVSTMYYKAMWQDKFIAQSTDKAVFHGTKGDTQVDMMHITKLMGVYMGKQYSAVNLTVNDGGTMYFILPEEGRDVDSLLSDDEICKMISAGYNGDEWVPALAHISVPKFKVSCKSDIAGMLTELGVRDVMDASKADFTPLTQTGGVFLGKAEHAAMVEIDEEGITGAAYTQLDLCGAGMPPDEMYFTVDRPFMFIITGYDNSVLFAGVIRNL